MAISDAQLQQLLVDGKFLTQDQSDTINSSMQEKHISYYDALLDKDYLTDENIGKLVADYYNLQPIVLKHTSIPHEVLTIIPENISKQHNIIAYAQDANNIFVATSNPENANLLELLKKKTCKNITVKYATIRDIEDTFSLYKKHLQVVFESMFQEAVQKAGKGGENDAPITQIVDMLIEYAYDNKASDIHIEPKKSESIIRFRIDGILHDVLHLPKTIHDQIITRIKVKSRLRTDEHFSAQDGKMTASTDHEDIDIRVSIIPIVHGEDCVMRLLTSRNRSFNLSNLGMNDHDLELVQKGFVRPYGMVLSTGPTGSGKTTTMYAIVKILNTRERNIATIEDPVEYDIEGISQIQVNPKTNLTFAEGLRSILRQDPDTIFVGEIRDRDTVGIAVNSALTGHLVLSTLHTNDAASSIIRMIDMGVEPFLIASSINIIIAQRLVRTICESCKISQSKSKAELLKYFPKELISKYYKNDGELHLYMGKGCKVCHNTGYIGRLGLFEVLEMTDNIKKLVVAKADSDDIIKLAKKEGMITMLEDGLDKIERGITTVEEVLRVTRM